MKKYLITLVALSAAFYMVSIYTAPTCSIKIVNDTGPTIWVVPTPGNPMIRENGSLILKEGIPNRLKITRGQSWNFNGTTFYVYVNQQSDVYKLSYKAMIHTCVPEISYSAIKNKTLNPSDITVQDLSGIQPQGRR